MRGKIALEEHVSTLKNNSLWDATGEASRNGSEYMQDVERTYRALWEAYCQRGDDGAAQYPAAD